MKLSKRKVDRAIRIVEESQVSHQRCLDDPDSEALGDPKFHRAAVEEYAEVLAVLWRVRRGL